MDEEIYTPEEVTRILNEVLTTIETFSTALAAMSQGTSNTTKHLARRIEALEAATRVPPRPADPGEGTP